jgi:ATP-dependent Lon protease
MFNRRTNDASENNEFFFPLMPLREVVIFPHSIVPLVVGRISSINAVEKAFSGGDKRLMLATQFKSEQIDKPGLDDLYPIGTLAKVLQVLHLPNGTIKVVLEGLCRARMLAAELVLSTSKAVPVQEDNNYYLVRAEVLKEEYNPSLEIEASMQLTLESLEEYISLNKKVSIPPEIIHSLSSMADPGRMADVLISYFKVGCRQKQEVLELLNPQERLIRVYEIIQNEIAVMTIERAIKTRVKGQMERNQREYYLNEQIKAINKEMGRDEDQQSELLEIEKNLKEKDLPEEVRSRGLGELKKLRSMQTSSAEYTVLRNYLDWILELPWNRLKETNQDIAEARRILDKDHYGLEKPKERIMEYLAVQKLAGNLKGPILCFVGPPGVGKTSLAKSVAVATGREFVRLSLGGVRDEAEIRGHRRTYVGALPGKILQSLKRAKYNNPLFCLDEIDKMTSDFRGDPSSALLEVLDPEQNNTFNDHYLDLDYDLSRIFFITTANNLHAVPLPLQDRMEIIRLPGYLETEKQHIARDYLLPKQIGVNGLKDFNLSLSDTAITEIIRSYTHEAGVRGLEREIAAICRKTAVQLVESENLEARIKVGVNSLPRLLGVKKIRHGERESKPLNGVCNGLAYTEVGGDILMVEAAVMPGQGKVNITGKLGEVMTESAKAALSYVRSRSGSLGLRADFHRDIDLHIHVPEGAIPKDGPSAGITLATALVSALLGLPVRNEIAMTGEITLRGRVLPIGGLREKLLAAHRAAIKTVILPRDNEKDMKDVPEDILRSLDLRLVEHVDEVLSLAIIAPEGMFDRLGEDAPCRNLNLIDVSDSSIQAQ